MESTEEEGLGFDKRRWPVVGGELRCGGPPGGDRVTGH